MVSQGVRAMPFGVVAVAIIKSKPPESARASRPLTVAIIHYPLCRASRPAVTVYALTAPIISCTEAQPWLSSQSLMPVFTL